MPPVENEVILEVFTALTTLSQRRLELRENEDRVATLIRRFKKAKKEIDRRHAKNIQDNPAPEGWEDTQLPVALLEKRQHLYNALMRETQEIRDIPANLYITEKDMPKLLKGEMGDQNRVGLSAIVGGLGFLFRTQFEPEEKVVDGKDGTSPEE